MASFGACVLAVVCGLVFNTARRELGIVTKYLWNLIDLDFDPLSVDVTFSRTERTSHVAVNGVVTTVGKESMSQLEMV